MNIPIPDLPYHSPMFRFFFWGLTLGGPLWALWALWHFKARKKQVEADRRAK